MMYIKNYAKSIEEREGLKSGLGHFTILLQSAQKAAGARIWQWP